MVLFFLYLKSSRHFSEQRYWLFSSIPTSLPSSMSQLHIVQYFIFTLLGEFAGLGTSATFGPGSVIPTSDKLVADTACFQLMTGSSCGRGKTGFDIRFIFSPCF